MAEQVAADSKVCSLNPAKDPMECATISQSICAVKLEVEILRICAQKRELFKYETGLHLSCNLH